MAAAAGERGGLYLWILRRLGFGLIVVFIVATVVFGATQALPNDPAQAILGKLATPRELAALREQLGLDRSLGAQYWDWLSGVLTGDLGNSLVGEQRSVWSLLAPRLSNSLSLLVIVAVIAIPVSILLGAIAAIRRDGLFDHLTLAASFGLVALPDFVVGTTLAIVLATTVFNWLPAVALIPPGASPFAYPREIALPVLTLIAVSVPYLYRLARASMIDVLESEYVAMARLKGMPERIVLLRHALPNALVPVTQASGLVLAYLLGGVVVVEFLFRFPGLGSLLTEAITNRDLPVIQAVVIVFAAGVVIFNLLADVLTVLVTPRLRTATRRRG